MSSPLAAKPIERDVVIVSGADAASHLQTQLSQDVAAIEEGRSAWSFLLNPKSAILEIVRVTRATDGALLLDADPGHGAPIRKVLDRFLSRMDVSFAEASWPGIALRGPGAQALEIDAPIVSSYPWTSSEAVDVVGPDVQLPDDLDRLTDDQLETIRIEARWPQTPGEIDGVATPAMTGVVDHTVSFAKGCYTGQEFVARVHFRDAKPPKQLVQIAFDSGAPISAGSVIVIDGESVGTVTSVAKEAGLGLAYCKRAVTPPTEAEINSVLVAIR